MSHTLHVKLCCLLLVALLGAALVVPMVAAGQEQELKTLKLVNTYQSEAEFQAANAKMLCAKHLIVEDEASIKFINSDTGEVRKRIQKPSVKPLTEEEKRKLSNDESITRNGVMYMIADEGEFLIQTEYTNTISSIGEFEYSEYPNITIKTRTLYDAQGKQVTTLPGDAENIDIKLSPESRYFLVHGFNSPGIPRFLSFYMIDGTLIKRREITDADVIKYSQNGEFVIVYSVSNPILQVFSKMGEVVYQGNYTSLIRETWHGLYGMFMSEQGEMMLLQGEKNIYLYATNGNLLWEKTSSYISDCYFVSHKGIIVAKTGTGLTNRSGENALQILSLKTGEALDEMTNVSDVTVMNEHIFITKEGKYYDYQIR